MTENSLDVLCILNRDGVFEYQQSLVETGVWDTSPDELAGQNAFSFVHPEDLAGARRSLAQVLQDPNLRVTLEVRFRRRDGSWCDLEVVGQSHLDDPQIAGVVLNARDISAAQGLGRGAAPDWPRRSSRRRRRS